MEKKNGHNNNSFETYFIFKENENENENSIKQSELQQHNGNSDYPSASEMKPIVDGPREE